MGRHAVAPTKVMLVQQKKQAFASQRQLQPSAQDAIRLPTLPSTTADKATFTTSFGIAGIPLLVVAIGCICWNVWLIILTINPNATANYLMDTQELDDGTFWLIIDPPVTVLVVGVIGLSIVLLGYVFMVLQMRWQLNRLRSLTSSFQGKIHSAILVTRDRLSSLTSSSNLKGGKRLTPIARLRSRIQKNQVRLLLRLDYTLRALSICL